MRKKVYILIVSLLAAAGVLCAASCDTVVWGADIKSYVNAGLSNVFIRNISTSPASPTKSVPSREVVTVTVSVVNPESLALQASLDCPGAPQDLSYAQPQWLGSDYESLSFTFTAPESAEQTTLFFTMTFFVPSTRKFYSDLPIPIRVDSPPDAPALAFPSYTADNKSFVAFLLPEGYRNEDIVAVRVTAQGETGAPISSRLTVQTDGNWVRWSPPGIDPYDGYRYSFVCIDAAGLESAVSANFEQTDLNLVFYNANGGTGLVLDEDGYEDEEDVILLTADALSREGYVFKEWNRKVDGSGESCDPGEAVPMATGGLEFWAQWEMVEYSITWNLDNGAFPVGTKAPTSYTVESPDITLPEPTQLGFRFDGWFDNADFTGNVVTEIPAGSTGDKTYYAKWVELPDVTNKMDVSGQELVFTSTTMSLAPNSQLQISCTNEDLEAGGTDWVWRVDGVVQDDQTTSTFTWTTPIDDIGQHIISCEVMYQGLSCSGSVTVTVDY